MKYNFIIRNNSPKINISFDSILKDVNQLLINYFLVLFQQLFKIIVFIFVSKTPLSCNY